jgi:phosphatidylglycerol:prolipoprotein diacylglycerol transferase
VHPAQLYEAFGCLAIFLYLALWLEPRKRFDGHVFLSFVALYAALRFVVEFFRADMRGSLGGLSTSQIIGIGMLAAAAWGWRRLSDVKLPAPA